MSDAREDAGMSDYGMPDFTTVDGRDGWANERRDILGRFAQELAKATGDGSRKRRSGEKPPWYEDGSHEAAIFSHIMKWKRGELVDPDSGAHPMAHAGWRCLAIACKESGNVPEAAVRITINGYSKEYRI